MTALAPTAPTDTTAPIPAAPPVEEHSSFDRDQDHGLGLGRATVEEHLS